MKDRAMEDKTYLWHPYTCMAEWEGEALAVRFPLPANGPGPAASAPRRLSALLPRRWRRRVVIQGQRFWLPG